MLETVVKRDGREVKYEPDKVRLALTKAFVEVDSVNEDSLGEKTNAVIAKITDEISKSQKKKMTVEEIQDIVENKLMATCRKDVAKAYILYRDERTRIRDSKSDFMQIIGEKLMATNVQNQNANVDEHSFGGRKGEADSEFMRRYALNNCMTKMARDNHLNNEIYIHDLDSYAVGMHNCCDRKTKFITINGVDSFENYKGDGTEKITVLTHTGNWEEAIVRKYGKQKLNKITFARAGQTFVTEKFTSNHRWILSDGTVTTQLKIGDKLIKSPMIRNFNFDKATDNEKYYWCLGFVLADGTEAYRWSHGKKNNDIKFVRMRLCGDKTKYEPRFSNIKHSTKCMDNGDLYLTFSSLIGFRKIFPDTSSMSWREKLALFDGLYSADGQHSGSAKSIFTSNEQIASFIEDDCPSLGYYLINTEDCSGEKTNYGIRDFGKEFKFVGDTNKYYWTVLDIEPDEEDDVWCLDVHSDHSFVLPNGIVTGNCLSIPFDKLLANGFNTRQTDVRPAQSVSTAFQLVAVIFQLQSLQQFGGVSATHLDWTMIPYVRKSFYKHYFTGMKYIDCEFPQSHYYNEFIQHITDPASISIEDDYYKEIPEVYQYALDMTTKEVYQAVEGMYHNLNTLQSRSGNQLN